jgi:hypothetical protein
MAGRFRAVMAAAYPAIAATCSSVGALVGREAGRTRWRLRYDDGEEELVLLPDPDVEILPRGGRSRVPCPPPAPTLRCRWEQ